MRDNESLGRVQSSTDRSLRRPREPARWIRSLALATLIGTMALFALACGSDDGETGSSGDADPLVVGSDIPYPPFEQGEPPDYTGFDIDLVNEIGARIAREVQFEDTSYDTIFRDLAQGKFDMVASASTITPEREEAVDFSDPYYLSEQAILITEGGEPAAAADLDGITVGAQQGTTGEAFVEDETDAAELRSFPEGPDAINALKAGTVDAVVIDYPAAQDAEAKQGGLEIAASIPTDEQYGLVFQPDGDDLREEVNAALQEMKDDGTYAEIYMKWFKQKPPEGALTATHEPT